MSDGADLVTTAWAARYRDPGLLLPLGQAIVAGAGADPRTAGWGWLQQAWGRRFRGERDAALEVLEMAEAAFARAAHRAGAAACHVLRANLANLAGDSDTALAWLARADAVPDDERHPLERQVACTTAFSAHYALERWDDGLRDLYAAHRCADAAGDDGAIGHALGLLGGLQADYANLDDALRLSTEALERCRRGAADYALIVAAMNRLNALVALGHQGEALALAQEMLERQAQMPAPKLEQAFIQFAWAHARAGQPQRAQDLLDRSVAVRQRGHLLEWTVTQAEIWNALGRHREARGLCEAHLATRPAGMNQQSPAEWLRAHEAAALACERLDDLAAALAHHRAARQLADELVGRAARARRLTLEIEHHLERERWQREEAQRRQREAEADRERLDALNRALESASLARSRFLAAASHDLRQPVHALALQVAALKPQLDRPQQREMVERIDRCIDALGGMFNSLLDLSRMDAGVVEPEWSSVALPALLARLVDEQRPVAERRGLRLAMRVPRGVAGVPHARTDAELLARMLRNLVVNALKFTERGGVLVTLRRRAPGWRVEVWDTGIGIAPALQARVFDEFVQAANEGRSRDEGLGLGLAIVQRLAKLLDHPLQLRSVPGRGTCIAIDLAAAVPAPAGTAPARGSERPLGLGVAVIEDDPDVRAALQSLLVQWGCRVRTAESAAGLLRDGTPADVVLADLRLPGGRNGLTEVARLRAAWGDGLAALVITGDTAAERLRELQASGLPWLPKPVQVGQLHAWLRAAAAAR